MSAYRQVIEAMVAAGMDQLDAAELLSKAVAECVQKPQKSAGAIRQERWRERLKASQSVTARRDDETSQSVSKRLKSVTRDAPSLSKKEEEIEIGKKSKRESRATALPDGWRPDPESWARAVERLGGELQAEAELEKFTNYALDKGRTSKRWGAAWASWVGRAIEYASQRRSTGPPVIRGRKQTMAELLVETMQNERSGDYASGNGDHEIGGVLAIEARQRSLD